MRRARKLYLAMGLALVAMLVAAGAVYAAVTFDSNTGKGFVGKGDVQLAFGWNNAQLQTNATSVTFSYDDQVTYSAVCTFTTAEGTPGEQEHNITIPRHTSIKAKVDADPRQVKGQKQFTGFILSGWDGAPVLQGTAPVVGETCVASDNGVARNGTWSSVSEGVSSGGGLYATFNGTSVLLPITPPATTV